MRVRVAVFADARRHGERGRDAERVGRGNEENGAELCVSVRDIRCGVSRRGEREGLRVRIGERARGRRRTRVQGEFI